MKPVPVQPLTRLEAQRTISRYVCSACWGNLTYRQVDDTHDLVLCVECKEETPGYVSKRYVERRQSESIAELSDARLALRDAVPWLKTNLSEDEINKELGF